MKRCSKCHKDKDCGDFFFRDKATGKLHAQCKLCYRAVRQKSYKAHYEKYKENYRERARERRVEKKTEFRIKMLEYLSHKECVLCGESDIRTFEFDHLDPSKKSFSISQAVKLGFTWGEVVLEIKNAASSARTATEGTALNNSVGIKA